MLLETIKALVKVGQEALQKATGLEVVNMAVLQVRQGNLTFPAIADVQIRSSTLQRVHFGCDQQMADHLRGKDSETSASAMAKVFLPVLLKEMEGRNPRGKIKNLEGTCITVHTRGVRTYGIRLATHVGQIFLLAEVPSKVELEVAKGSEFLASMRDTYLPQDWNQRDHLDNKGIIDNLLVLVRKLESDFHLETPLGDGTSSVHPGILLDVRKVDGQHLMKLSTDLPKSAEPLQIGQSIRGCFGLDDRSLEFQMSYMGPASHPLVGDAVLDCSLFTVPESLEIIQRRKAFRIPVQGGVQVEVARIVEGIPPQEIFRECHGQEIIRCRLADLSFAGARVIADRDQMCTVLAKDQRVICRMIFPDQFEPLDVLGVVRRSTVGLANRNQWQDEIGLEFLVSPHLDRGSLEFIREYVLSEQRARLAHRIRVGG